MKHMEPISILAGAFRFQLWQPVQIWQLYPCIRAAEVLHSQVFFLPVLHVHAGYVRQIINLTQTTSGSYLLMSSLDISRRNLAQRGRQIFHQVADMAEYAREEINAIGGYYAFGKELVNGNSVFDFDITKLSVHTLDIGLAGIEVYDILRDEYDIQIEFGDIGNILAYLSIGDRTQEVERLVSALAEIRRRFQTDGSGLLSQEYIDPTGGNQSAGSFLCR